MKKNPSILVFCRYYIPAYKAGGALRTIANMVDTLGDDISFFIVTSDRDLGDKKPFTNINSNKWSKVGKAKVYYMHPKSQSSKKIQTSLRPRPLRGVGDCVFR